MTLGMFLLSSSSNLIMMYLSIEIMSLSSYVLAGYTKEIKRASEASLKYVIYGAVSSGIMIYGISIIFGLTGSLNLYEINTFLANNDVNLWALLIPTLMIIAGIGYKISAVPFHFWTPDVYEGAPVTITALLSVASKAAGFAMLIRFVKIGFIDSAAGGEYWTTLHLDWQHIIALLSVLTMTLGNLVALWQTNVKRLLAYSSIAHAGYMLMGLVVMNDAGVAAILIYFFMYLFMNLGAFYFVLLIANKTGSENIEDYQGLGYKAPRISVCMVIFLISLTGLHQLPVSSESCIYLLLFCKIRISSGLQSLVC
jgi:NADH-quinone oxidoreductase subunit N